MIDKQKILDLKKDIVNSEEKINAIGKDQFLYIQRLSEWLLEIITKIDIMKTKQKRVENAGRGSRVKMMKQGMMLFKEIKNFKGNAAVEFSEGHIPKELAKKIEDILKIIGKKDFSLSEEDRKYFEGIAELDKQYKQSKNELKEIEETLKKDKIRIEIILEKLKELENNTIDFEKVKKYEKILSDFEQIKKLRKEYISFLISLPIIDLLTNIRDKFLEKYNLIDIKKDELEQIINFFSENQEVGNHILPKLCELFNYSEKKLSYIFPETSKFKRIVLINRIWLEELIDLERTKFLLFDIENQEIINFYSENVKGSKQIIENFVNDKDNIRKYKEEYEKNERIKEKTRELSKYSKTELEKENKEIDSCLELLYSKYNESTNSKPKEEKQGLFSKIVSLFK